MDNINEKDLEKVSGGMKRTNITSTDLSEVFRSSKNGICPMCGKTLVITRPYAYVGSDGKLHSRVGKKACSSCGYSTYNMF